MFFHKNFTAAYVKFAENESFVNGELRFEQIGATGYINVYGAILGLFNGQFGHGYRVNILTKIVYIIYKFAEGKTWFSDS